MTDTDTVERVKKAIRQATPYQIADALVDRSARAAIAALPPAVHYCPNCGNAHHNGVDRFCDTCLRDEPTTPDPVPEMMKEELRKLRRDVKISHISVEAMAEIKAVVDGGSTQPIRDIVYGAIDEIRALTKDGD